MDVRDATTSLADDLKELNLERPVTKAALKSSEELEQLTVDEQLSDIERAVYLLRSMEEIEIFKNAESPTGERIKLFVDELESLDLEAVGDTGHHTYDLPSSPSRLTHARAAFDLPSGPSRLAHASAAFDLPSGPSRLTHASAAFDLVADFEDEFDSGQEVQRISVINNLPDLLRDSHADCMRRVVPKVREVLHVAQADMQLAASSAFVQILEKDLVPVHNYSQTFLQTILSSVDNKDPEIALAWLETLLDVIDLLPKDIIKKEILTVAIEKGQLSQPVQTRLSCCKILGKIATRFEPYVIKKEILPIVQSLCQDVEYEVRGCMCQQLDPVARGLGLEATKSAILPELVELTNDEESFVRIAGLQTVVNILSLVDEDTCRATLIPLVCKFCSLAVKNEDVTLPIVGKEVGRLCHGFAAFLADEQKQWFVEYFKQMCRVGLSDTRTNRSKDVEKDSPSKEQQVPMAPDIIELERRLIETRQCCAFNFPAMVMFVGGKSFKSELGTCFSSLCKDPNVDVRKSLSFGFHEIAGLLGNNETNLLGDLIALLKDEDTEVLKGVVMHLPQTLASICGPLTTQAMHEAKQNQISDIIPAILCAEVNVAASNDWRLQETIIDHFKCFQYLTNSDCIFQRILPVLLHKLRKARALPVRLAAARSTLYLIRNLKKMEHRAELLQILVTDFCHAKSCHNRSLFIDICRVTIEYYSKAFFKETFFQYLISLHTDSVPNIRYRLCSILPDLKRLIKLPSDKSLHQLLDMCVRHLLIGEKDCDVSLAVKCAVEEMDKIPVQMESSMSRRIMMEEDIDDARKEAEERKLIEAEEREIKKEEEAAKARAEKKGHKDTSATKIPAPRKSAVKSSSSKSEQGSAGVRRTPSTTNSSSSTTSTCKDTSATKVTSKTSRSGMSTVSTPTSAGSRKSKTEVAAGRRGSFNNSPTSDKVPPRKNSNGSNSSTTKLTKKTSK